MFAALVFQATGQTQPRPMVKIRIDNNVVAYDDRGRPIDFPVFVTLYKDGQAIRTTDLNSNRNPGSGIVRWEELPTGSLEVHFEARATVKLSSELS